MKIGILTVWDMHNYGSYLQANALKRELEKMGHKVYFMPYEKGKVFSNINNIQQKKNKIVKYISKISEYKKFLTISKRRRIILKQVKRNFIKYPYKDGKGLDCIIIGSDELWNIKNRDIGLSPSFWGENLKCDKIVVYANSFGSTDYQHIETNNLLDYMTKRIEKMNYVTVRDKTSRDILNKLMGRDFSIVLDPTLLEDENKFSCIKLPKYILVYVHSYTDKEVEYISNFAKEKGLKIYSLGNYADFAEKIILPLPELFSTYFKFADYVYTSTFHGTVFSVKVKANFVSMIQNQKAEYLLESLGLAERIIHDPSESIKLWNKNVDYSKYDSLIKEKRSFSNRCITDMLKIE